MQPCYVSTLCVEFARIITFCTFTQIWCMRQHMRRIYAKKSAKKRDWKKLSRPDANPGPLNYFAAALPTLPSCLLLEWGRKTRHISDITKASLVAYAKLRKKLGFFFANLPRMCRKIAQKKTPGTKRILHNEHHGNKNRLSSCRDEIFKDWQKINSTEFFLKNCKFGACVDACAKIAHNTCSFLQTSRMRKNCA